MKKIVLKGSLFIGLLLIVNIIIRSLVPYWWGNPGFIEKYEYLKDNKDKYNMVLLGSSRIYRQVIPDILDKRLKKYNIKSFNMAYAATSNPESFYLTKKLLKEKWFDFDYVVIELSAITLIDQRNLHTARIKYSMNLESVNLALASLSADNKLSFTQFYRHISTYIEHLFNFGLIDDIVQFKMREKDKSNYKELANNGGYEKFDENPKSLQYKRRHLRFLKKNRKKLEARAKNAHRISKKYSNDKTIYNQVYLNRVKELINIAEKKEIDIFFIIPPRAGSGKMLLTTANNLGEEYSLVFYDSKKYPQFYSKKYSWDLGHLNYKGSKRFTRTLAKEISKKLKSEKKVINNIKR